MVTKNKSKVVHGDYFGIIIFKSGEMVESYRLAFLQLQKAKPRWIVTGEVSQESGPAKNHYAVSFKITCVADKGISDAATLRAVVHDFLCRSEHVGVQNQGAIVPRDWDSSHFFQLGSVL